MNSGFACWMPTIGCGNFLKTISQNSSSKASDFDSAPYLYLTTRGRSSGKPREIEIWFTRRDLKLYVIAEHASSNWVQNIQVHNRVCVRVIDQAFDGTARLLGDDHDRGLIRAVQELSRLKYGWGEGVVVEIVADTPACD